MSNTIERAPEHDPVCSVSDLLWVANFILTGREGIPDPEPAEATTTCDCA